MLAALKVPVLKTPSSLAPVHPPPGALVHLEGMEPPALEGHSPPPAPSGMRPQGN